MASIVVPTGTAASAAGGCGITMVVGAVAAARTCGNATFGGGTVVIGL